jgi:hypothetical protein
VNQQQQQVIADVGLGWDGQYQWQVRFHINYDEEDCYLEIKLKIQLPQQATKEATKTLDRQAKAWKRAIEGRLSRRFKLCCGCICPEGIPIRMDVDFTYKPADASITVGPNTENMELWGANDTTDVVHEAGHMLGAKDQYGTVDGTPYGPGRQPTGNLMNNPANAPEASLFNTVRDAVNARKHRNCTVHSISERCP